MIPKCLLELPGLTELNLSSNKLTEIPDVHEWSPGLTVLDLSYNELSYLPNDVIAPSIRTLLISNNKFRTVPLCICSFFSLQYLDISENPDILSLPVEMGRLSNLNKLVMKGLKDLSDPPRNMQKDARDCIRYLNSKLRSARKFFRMKLMLVGKQDRGKTTLVSRLQGLEAGQNQSTVGVDVSEWNYAGGFGRRRYQFSIWDFGGQEEYYATHQCFLSERSMYLLLWNVKHGEEGVAELKPWLDNISLRAPQSCVLIVGTHLDEVHDSERPIIDGLLNKVGELALQYPKLQISEVLAVGLMNRLENIGALREAIYEHATKYKGKGSVPVMGQEIPASYFQLNKELDKIQEEVRKGTKEPVMHAEQFKDLVQQLKLPDICSDEELRTATLFLNEVGTILHYDDRSHSLNELYFIDPRWLCDMMSKVVTIRERNPFVKNGILHSKDIPLLFKDERFPWLYFEQYLTLLDRFEIALPLDNKRILIPSMLPEERPSNADLPDDPIGPYYRRYIVFQTPCPPGFWSRLISRIMHTVPEVCRALDYFSRFEEVEEEEVETDEKPLPSPSTSVTDEASAQQVDVSTLISSPTEAKKQPFELPNIRRFIVGEVETDGEQFDKDEIEITYWKEGIAYKSPDLNFCVESLNQSRVKNRYKQGILLMTSPSTKGTKTICHLVDMVVTLIHEWYPGLEEGLNPGVNGVQQRVPCYECLKLKRSVPFEFRIDEYMSIITSNRLKIECGYDTKNPSNNHVVSLADIMPDLLLKDLDKGFLLKPDEIFYQEDKDSLLGEGGFGKVYRGKCRGKNVAIKKYINRSEDAFNELRGEAKVLQKSHHPCLVCLVGVSIHPLMALVLEEAPMGALERHLIKKPTPIPRIVMFRMAAEIAAALRFLHHHGIIFRDLKAANVLLWSLEEKSLCHCKVTDFGIATHLAPFGALGIQGTKGFIAPEVLFIGKKKAVYNHKADIFSFSMLLYQMIARRHPFHNIPPVKIDPKVVSGERPSIIDVHLAETGYFYLAKLMEQCWQDKPNMRPDTDELIAKLSDMTMISIMAITPVRSRFSLRRGCAITPHDYAKANASHAQSSELWICCDGSEGAELNIFNTNRMVKLSKNFIKDNQVQCMCVCGDHVWVCSRSGIEYGVIDIFNIISRELVHNVRMKENAVCCITAAEDCVYLGTLEGYVFAFSMDLKKIQANDRPRHQYISENAIEGIAVTNKHVWVAHTKFMFFLNLDTLKMEHQLTRNHQNKDAFIGSLTYSPDVDVVWSAHLGGTVVSAWNGEEETHMFDIDTRKVLFDNEKTRDYQDYDAIMTTMTPVLDTLWVGMATGHILVFHNQDLMYFIRPYKQYIRFLIPIPCEGPTGKEKCMVVSGAKCFNSPVPSCPVDLSEATEHSNEASSSGGITASQSAAQQSGVMILWEAFNGESLHQMKTLENEGHGYLENHRTVQRMIRSLDFEDGTNLIVTSSKPPQQATTEAEPQRHNDVESSFIQDGSSRMSMLTQSVNESSPLEQQNSNEAEIGSPDVPYIVPSETFIDGIPTDEENEDVPLEEDDVKPLNQIHIPAVRARGRSLAMAEETFDIEVCDNLTSRITVPKPVQLENLMSNLKNEGNYATMKKYSLMYRQSDSGELVEVNTQDVLDNYLDKLERPKLVLMKK